MVKIKMKPINVSNTTLSLYGARRHRKFDAKQSKRHDYGTALCAVCDKVFTKYHWRITTCSEECKRLRKKAEQRKHYEENSAKVLARQRKDREENREKYNAKQRTRYHANPQWVVRRKNKRKNDSSLDE